VLPQPTTTVLYWHTAVGLPFERRSALVRGISLHYVPKTKITNKDDDDDVDYDEDDDDDDNGGVGGGDGFM